MYYTEQIAICRIVYDNVFLSGAMLRLAISIILAYSTIMSKDNRSHYLYGAKLTILFTTIITLLIISLSAAWLNRVIFDTNRFTSTASAALLEQSSRDSIGRLVADRLLENRPVLDRLIAEPVANVVSSFLATEQAQSGIERTVREGQLLFTSPQKPPVVLDFTPYKSAIVTAQQIIPNEGEQRIDVNDIPDAVVLIDTTQLPNFYEYSLYTNFAGPAAFVAAVVLAGAWIWRGKANRYGRSRAVLVAVLAAGIIAVVLGPIAEPAFVSIGRDAASQTILGNLYDAFITPFRNQALVLAGTAILGLVALIATHEIRNHFNFEFKTSKK